MKLFFALVFVAAVLPAQSTDPILRAMQDELQRSTSLQLPNLEKPYYIDFSVDTMQIYSAVASLGGVISSQENFLSLPRVRVHVGDYAFDNTNFLGTNFGFQTQLPREANYLLVRRIFWLDTDRAYKAAVEAMSRKRAALKSMTQSENLTDFEARPPWHFSRPAAAATIDFNEWRERVRRVSRVFAQFPVIKSSSVSFFSSAGDHRFVNTEGTEVRHPDSVAMVRISASAQAADGMTVQDWAAQPWLDPARLPNEAMLRASAEEVARNAAALAAAPIGEDYSGPVLFEGVAGAQVFAEVFGRNLALSRKPVGQSGAVPASELEGRQGVRVLPEMFDVVDDPKPAEFHGQPLLGTYAVDDEGVAAERLQIVEKGILRNFLLTRSPKRGFPHSNGHARLPGSFGSSTAALSNLFVTSRETMPPAELKKHLIQICQQRGKPYGVLIRKMDFPSGASLEDARRLLGGQQGGLHPVSAPLLAYRVYPDGHEELVRGLRLRAFNAKSLRDILFAGDDHNILNYMDNGAPFALAVLGGSTAESSVIAPSLLIDDVDLFKVEDDLPKLPVVPPPPLT
jgi:TldD protein